MLVMPMRELLCQRERLLPAGEAIRAWLAWGMATRAWLAPDEAMNA